MTRRVKHFCLSCVYLVVCVWVYRRCLHVYRGLRRLDNHVVHIVPARGCRPQFGAVVLGALSGSGNAKEEDEGLQV